ncbi:MAG: lipid core--O-antigen ligase [Chitinophagaceae bacterium]|nr:lipid core--O-antigen ligase [Chitinophagaceae bacterium]
MTIGYIYAQSGTNDWKNKWILACAFTLIAGLYVSAAMMSIGMIATALLLFTPGALPQIASNLRNQPLYILLFGIFAFYLVSGLYSENLHYWGERVQIKLPYLLLPFSFAAVSLTKRTLYTILYLLFITVSIGAVWCLINFTLNYDAIVESYLHAKVMPTPFDIGHIRFSLMSAFSAFIGWILYKDQFVFKAQWERYVLLGGALFLVIFLHILSVRSGLLAFYGAAGVYLILEVWKNKNFKQLIVSVLFLAMISGAMYFLSPTLRNKAKYMNKDVSRFKEGGNVNHYSDGNRLLSWQLGWRIGNENPLIGAGIGDVLDEIKKIYIAEYPEIEERNWLIPHSQFVYIFAGCGWLGLLWFAAACFYPYLDTRLRNVGLFMIFNTIIVTSFISESTLEIQLGVALHLFFLLLLLSYTNPKPAEE